jgi:hypothetical protein
MFLSVIKYIPARPLFPLQIIGIRLKGELISMRNDSDTSDEPYIVPAVEQAMRIMFCLASAESSHAGLVDICGKVGLHRSRVFCILRTLQKFGVVQRNTEGKGYSLGPGLIGLSRRFLDNLSAARLAEPILETW